MNSGWREPRGQWARLRPKQPDGPVRGEAGRNQTPSCAAVPPPARGLTGQIFTVLGIGEVKRLRNGMAVASSPFGCAPAVAVENEAAGIDHGGATLAISPWSRRGEAVRAYPHPSLN